jgi:hypothetical protein
MLAMEGADDVRVNHRVVLLNDSFWKEKQPDGRDDAIDTWSRRVQHGAELCHPAAVHHLRRVLPVNEGAVECIQRHLLKLGQIDDPEEPLV